MAIAYGIIDRRPFDLIEFDPAKAFDPGAAVDVPDICVVPDAE